MNVLFFSILTRTPSCKFSVHCNSDVLHSTLIIQLLPVNWYWDAKVTENQVIYAFHEKGYTIFPYLCGLVDKLSSVDHAESSVMPLVIRESGFKRIRQIRNNIICIPDTEFMIVWLGLGICKGKKETDNASKR